jgi:uncharacterized membrane protein
MPPLHPARDAASLLRRIGFGFLLVAMPVAALVSRRAVVVLAPLGMALLVLAALLDKEAKPIAKALRSPLNAPVTGFAVLLLGWAALSLAWTPYLAEATERLGNIVLTLILLLAGYLAMPERMRAANLYLAPVGIALAAASALLFQIWGSIGQAMEVEAQNFARALIGLVLLAWPAIAWLVSRRHRKEALTLAVLLLFAIVPGFLTGATGSVTLIVLAVSSLVFLGCLKWPKRAPVLLGNLLAGALVLAPLLPFVLAPIAEMVSLRETFALWRESIALEPVRLVTGHGFETAIRGRALGVLPPYTPSSLLFELWYELGIVGVCALAAALVLGAKSLPDFPPAFAAGMAAALAGAFLFSALGMATTQSWWITLLAVVMLAFVALQRSYFETRRPKALLLALPPPKTP